MLLPPLGSVSSRTPERMRLGAETGKNASSVTAWTSTRFGL